ncbi:MAG: NAD+ synthase [Calditrichaeota bacterium]|nr:NAD+ synthase [Calditrichota bacterium]RQV92938.1 MAG: NAD+ synthase [bacterium]RQW07985.1 MAG: NAD+ synthase [Calditrichota bacterium]
MRILRLALAQINHVVGDFKGNYQKISEYIDRARDKGADLIAFPELCLTGYPPEDLLLKPGFIEENLTYLHKIVDKTEDITAIIGFVDRDDDIYNSAAIIHHKKLAGIYHKIFLPNYGVFDEDRYFQAGQEVLVFVLNDVTIGVNICEDIWYPGGPTRDQALYGGAEVVINISSSPYYYGKGISRYRMLATRAEDNVVIVAYLNTVGGQDELVFDGNSMVISEEGSLISKSPSFEEHLLLTTLHPDNVFNKRIHDPRRRKEKIFIQPDRTLRKIPLATSAGKNVDEFENSGIIEFLDLTAEVYKALQTGLIDYVKKNGFGKVVLGISGGIDSALVLAIAADSLGKENVIGISMPSQFTSEQSKADARKIAENFGIRFYEIPITDLYENYLKDLKPVFGKRKKDTTEENIQARIRGNLLMAFSNKFGLLVLATGNKSEISVGYCTLYGDMVGGFSVIKDVYKTMVYDLVRYRNNLAGTDIIPQSILNKAPSAELKEDQKDTDSLPPYDILDPILKAYVEEDHSVDEIISFGFEERTVKKVVKLIDQNEYKRRQAAPGIKITNRAFGKDRRFPITNRYTGNNI